MENIFEKKLVNNNYEEMDNSKIRFCNKIKANKKNIFLIGLSLISLLLFYLIIILFFKKSDENGTSLEKASSSSLNDPYFKKYSEFFPFSLRVNKEGQIRSNKLDLLGEKCNICSLSIKRENIVFSKSFLNKIKDLSKN